MANQSSSAGRSSNLLRRLLCCINPSRHSASQQLPPTSHDHKLSIDVINTLNIEEEELRCMAAAGQDGLLYIGRSSGKIQSFKKGQEEVDFTSNRGPVKDIIIDAESRIISGYNDLHIDVTTRSDAQPPLHQVVLTLPLDTVKGHRKPISSLCLSDDSKFLYSGDKGGIVYVWDLSNGRLIKIIGNSFGTVNAIATGTGGLVFTGSSDDLINVYQRVAGADGDDRPKHVDVKLLKEDFPICAVMFKDTEDGGGLYAGLVDGTLKFFEQSPDWKRPAGTVIGSHSAPVTCIAALTGPLLCSGSQDGVIFIWRQEQGSSHTRIKELMTNQSPLRCLVVQDDWEDNNDRSILYTGSSSEIKIWQMQYNMA